MKHRLKAVEEKIPEEAFVFSISDKVEFEDYRYMRGIEASESCIVEY